MSAAAGSARASDAVAWLRAYAEQRIDSRLMDERRCIPPHVVLDFGNRGLLGLQVAEAHGGLGLGHRDAMRVVEQLAAIDIALATFIVVHNFLGVRTVDRAGTPAVRDELLPGLASGRELAAFALTEPGAGSNPGAMAARAVARPDGGWALRGTKAWTGSGAWAGVLGVFARVPPAAGAPGGVTGFLLRAGAPGLRHGPEALTMGMRAWCSPPSCSRTPASGPGTSSAGAAPGWRSPRTPWRSPGWPSAPWAPARSSAACS